MKLELGPAMLAVFAAAGFVAVPAAIVSAPDAAADVCANVGRRVSVSGCVDVAGAVAPYAPPPAMYAPLPEDFTPNASVCAGWNGRWVTANGCT